MRLFKQLVVVLAVLAVLGAGLMVFTFDIIKVEWVSFMEIQDSYGAAENPLPLPARSVPIEGAAFIPNMGAPQNPVPADEDSAVRGGIFYEYNCKMCHGPAGDGKGGTISPFLTQKQPTDLTSALVQDQADGDLFLTLTNGKGLMPYFKENLSVRDRWDVVNYIRTLKTAAGGTP